jgi:hypothetical protein
MSELFLLKKDGNLIGVFSSYFSAKKHFSDNCTISICLLNQINTVEDLMISKRNVVKPVKRVEEERKELTKEEKKLLQEKLKEHDEKYGKIAQQKTDMVHDINILKTKKKKLEESKKMYDNDLDLYNKFKMEKNFKVPELFLDKYNIFEKLEKENNLSWETFRNSYKPTTYYNEDFETNEYEKIFEKVDISEELNF